MAGPTNPFAAAAAQIAADMQDDGAITPIVPDPSAATGDMGAVRVAPSAPIVPDENPYAAAVRSVATEIGVPDPIAPVAVPDAPAASTPTTPTTAPDQVGPLVEQQSAVATAVAEDFLNNVRPEVVAEIRRISREQGTPLPLAAQTYMEQSRAQPGAAYRRLLQQNPGLRQIASQGSAYADLMSDAAELATVENAFNTVRSGVIGAVRFPTVSVPRGLAEFNDVLARGIANTLRAVLPEAVTAPIDAAGEDLLALQAELGFPILPSDILRDPATTLDDIYTFLDTPEAERTLTTDLGGALGQFGAQAAFYVLTGGQGALLTNFLASVDEQAQRVEQADAYGTAGGDIGIIGAAGVNALLDQLNLDVIFERVPEGLRNRMFRILASGTSEGVTEMLQAMSSNLIAQQVYDPSSGLIDDAAYEGLLGGIVGAFAGALVPGRGGVRRPEDDEELPPEVRELLTPGAMETATAQAEQAQLNLETTRAAIEESQTFIRDPDAVRELLEAAGDQPITIPVAEVERLYQEGALTDDDIAYLQIEDELTQQGELSGDVSTTASRVLTLQGDAFAALSEHVRAEPSMPTVAEARAAVANREADVERLRAVLDQAQAAAGEVDRLTDTIYQQLRQVRALTAGQNRAAARLMAERYAARAALFEPGTTAQSLYETDRVAFEGTQAASVVTPVPDAARPAPPTVLRPEGDALAPPVFEGVFGTGAGWVRFATADRLPTEQAGVQRDSRLAELRGETLLDPSGQPFTVNDLELGEVRLGQRQVRLSDGSEVLAVYAVAGAKDQANRTGFFASATTLPTGADPATIEAAFARSKQLFDANYSGLVQGNVVAGSAGVAAVLPERQTAATEVFEQGPVPAADRLDTRAPVRSPRGSTYMGVGPQYTVENTNTDAPALQRNAPMIQASTNANNAEAQSDALDVLLERHPNPLSSEAAWVDMANDAFSLDRVPMPPFRTIEIVQQGADTIADEIRQLSEGMRRDAEAGLETAKEFGEVYASGAATPDITAKAFLWSFLSRGVSPYVQEAAFLDAIVSDRLTSIMQRATADGWSDALEAEYGEWAASAIPPGSPGRGTQHNLNAFGRNFMRVMTQRHDDAGGRTGLEIIHGMIADGTPSYLIRREFLKRGSGAGIDNKVVSFTLLLLGRSDVLVLDRVQVRNQWNDGRFDGQNIYDSDIDADGKQVTGSAFAEMTFGHKGLLYYETMERALQPLIEQAYASLGIEGSLGRYHWDSWLLASNQEVGHASVEGLLRDAQQREAPYVGAFVRQGKYANYDYGFRYGVLPDGGLSTVVERLDGTGATIVPYAVMADPKSPARKVISRLSTAAKKRGTEYGSVRPWTAALTTEERATYDNAIADAGSPAPDVWQYDPNAVGRAAAAREQRGTGSYSDGELAPLEGAPTVAGAAGPDPSLVAIAEQYAAANGISLRRQAEFVEVDPERAARIAQAYDEMPHSPQDPEVKAAYQNLIEQTVAQYEALVAGGYEFYFFDENSDPYDGNPWNAMRDLRANKRMGVYATEAGFGSGATELNVDDNPMLADTGIMWSYGSPDGPQQRVLANDLFRAVHDAFGHGIEGAGFRARGEENAWQAHVRLFTGSAVAAITTETRGQNSWLNYGPYGEQNRTASVEDTVFADQKTGLMPSFTWEEGRAADEPAAPMVLEQPQRGPQTQNQGEVGAPRGSYTLPTNDDPRNLIRLSANADPSTFVHEVGHMFLFQMLRDIDNPKITPEGRAQLEQQIAATRTWFNTNAEQGLADLKKLAKDAARRAKKAPKDREAALRSSRLNAAVSRAEAGGGAAYMASVADAFMDPTAQGYDEAAEVVYHELWARGFEQYLGTGSAPSAALRSTFAKFAKFITSVYKSLRRLNVTVSPEIADVFDRLLATEDAIIEERRGALYQISPGVLEGATPAEANELRRLAAEAETEARTDMASRVENSLRADAKAVRRARREQLANEVSEQVAAEPVYVAINVARRGTLPDGTKTNTGKIDRTELLAVVGEEAVARMPQGTVSGKVRPANAIPLGDLATLSGFPDIYSMIEALTNPTPVAEADAVRERVDAIMREEFAADFDEAQLKAHAVEAAQNDKFQQLQQLQLRILRRLAQEPMSRIARRQAEQAGAPAAAVDQQAATAARTEQAAARTPQEGVQAALARIRSDVQKTANASQRRAQTAARRQTQAIQRNIDPAAVAEAARRYVTGLKVKDATPARYRQAASRLTVKIERAIAARDYDTASSLMEQRALNLAVAKEAAAIQTMVEQKRRRWRDVTGRTDKRLAQSYDINWINALRLTLEPFGLGRNTPRNYDPAKALASIKGVEPSLFNELQAAMLGYVPVAQRVQAANPNNPYKDLTVAEISDLFASADRMLANARDSMGMLIKGRRVGFEIIAGEVEQKVSQRKKVQKQARAREAGRGTRRFRETRRQVGSFLASLRRIELWARDIDNGDTRGPVTTYLVRPVMAAIDAYTAARRGPQEALAALLRDRRDIMQAKPIRATELDGYVFQTKGELIMALLHTGNDSNKRKLLLGGAVDVATGRQYVWGEETADGDVNTTRWDQFIDRMFSEDTLTKADMDLVQGIWDIFESTKPAAQAAHKQMYGYNFTEIEASPVSTPVGIYPGGYAPAITDTMINPDGDRFEAEEVMSQQSNAAMFPGAERGFTQSRVEYNQPLDLDLTRIPAHFDRVMKFAYLGPAVRNAARLVTNPAFRAAINPASPDILDVAVIPWLQRTVQQRVTTPPTNRGWSGVSKVAAAIDRRVGLTIMAGNIVNAAQQVTGFSVAAARLPVRHLAAASTRWRVDGASARQYIAAQSVFMQERMSGGMNEATTTLENILREPGLLSSLQAASMRYGYFAQQLAQNMVDPTVWLAAERHGMEIVYPAAYAEELKRTGDEAAADAAARAEVVAYADSVVRDTQAPMQASDVSGIEASSPLARLFLKFYSYFNAMGNLLATERNITINSEMGWAAKRGRNFYAYLMIVAVPSIVAESLAQLARGGLDDLDDEDERDQLMFELLIGSQIQMVAAMVPYAGSVVSTAYGVAVTDVTYDDRLSVGAGIGVTEAALGNTIRLIQAAIDPDTDVDTRRAIRTTLETTGLILGLPTNWLAKPLGYAAQVRDGEASPEGLVDIVQGVLTGRDGTED